jgi:putative transposase
VNATTTLKSSDSLRHLVAKDLVVALTWINQSATADETATELDALEAEWGDKYQAVVRLWRGNWDNIILFFQFLPEIRKVMYTTNAIESPNMVMRNLTRNRRIFPNDDYALKSLFGFYPVNTDTSKKRHTMPKRCL